MDTLIRTLASLIKTLQEEDSLSDKDPPRGGQSKDLGEGEGEGGKLSHKLLNQRAVRPLYDSSNYKGKSAEFGKTFMRGT